MTDKKTTTEDVASPDLSATVIWREEPAKHDYPAAANYLGLLADGDTVSHIVDRSRRRPSCSTGPMTCCAQPAWNYCRSMTRG